MKVQCPGNPLESYSSRREFLYVGLLGAAGLGLPQFFGSRANAAVKQFPQHSPVAESVIHIFLPGGLAHQESFDPKPFAPAEYRGPFGAIDTKLPGVQFGQFMKETAKIADKITVIRSMSHGEAAHERGTHNMFTGYRPSPALAFPSIGSVVSHELGSRNDLPPYVCVPNVPNEYASSGYLSSAYGPSPSEQILPKEISKSATSISPTESMKNASTAAARFLRPWTTISGNWKNPTPSIPWTRSISTPTNSFLPRKPAKLST